MYLAALNPKHAGCGGQRVTFQPVICLYTDGVVEGVDNAWIQLDPQGQGTFTSWDKERTWLP